MPLHAGLFRRAPEAYMTAELTSAITAPFEIKAIDEGARTFKGLSATWDEDLGGDVIYPGAFTRTIDHFKSSGRIIPLMDGHPEAEGMAGQRVRRVIGKVLDASETKAGVETHFQMVPDDPDADAALRRVKGGFVTGLSIAYKAINQTREKGKRHIRELKWFSTGMILTGMNPNAQADPTSVKGIVQQLQDDTLTEETKALLMQLPTELKTVLRALLDDPPAPLESAPVGTQNGLAPDDPRRKALQVRLRGLKLRRLASVR